MTAAVGSQTLALTG